MDDAIEQVRRVLWIRTDRLGETLLNLPAVAALHASLPSAKLTLLVHPSMPSLLEALPWMDRALAFDHAVGGLWWRRAFTLARQLRSFQFDAVVVSNPKKELHLAVWLAGIPCRVGYDRKWAQLLTHRVPDRKSLGERHEVEYNLDLAKAVIDAPMPAPLPQWQLPPFEREQGEVLQLLEQHGIPSSESFIAVHPWTSNPLKQWPPTRFQALIRALSQRLPIVVIGGPEERVRIQEVLPSALPRVAELVGRLSLRQLAALLQRARLLVSNDSGPVHLAAAVNARTVVLFGTSDPATGPRRWGPWGVGHAILHKPSMNDITVDEVVAAVSAALAHV